MQFLPGIAVLLMAYGTPSSEDDVEGYLTDIRRGHKPSQEAVQKLKERYRRIGGCSPLLDITNAQAMALEKNLNNQGVGASVYVGMKHWHPYIREILPRIAANGFHEIIALALAPYYSQISVGGYKQALDQAATGVSDLQIDFVETWYDNALFHRAVAEKITEALVQFQKPEKVQVLFTAHSLPERILQQGDPYPSQLRSSCQAVASLLKLDRWSFAYQSAGETGERWLGPDILEALQEMSGRNTVADVLVVPIGFVADHLEILYDIDVEAQAVASKHGLNLKRTRSLNSSPTFISALADIVSKRPRLHEI